MSMAWKLFPSLLFCHFTCSGDGVDDTTAAIIALEPKWTVEFAKISTLGMPEKNECQRNINFRLTKLNVQNKFFIFYNDLKNEYLSSSHV